MEKGCKPVPWRLRRLNRSAYASIVLTMRVSSLTWSE